MEIYDFLYEIYDYYNRELFEGQLPYVVITLEEREKVRGYFSPSRFTDSRKNIGQLCINPQYFIPGNEERVYSTIVHEMCHILMKMKGEDVVKGYHSVKWAEQMMRIGLIPTSDGTEKGKKTGFSVTHLIEKEGLFSVKTKELIEKRKMLFSIFSSKINKEEIYRNNDKSVPGKRIRYECGCSSFWGKKGMNVYCKKCNKDFISNKN